jgi:exosome complex RNA-binding protein Rrp42 (RNase PH superfamily)
MRRVTAVALSLLAACQVPRLVPKPGDSPPSFCAAIARTNQAIVTRAAHEHPRCAIVDEPLACVQSGSSAWALRIDAIRVLEESSSCNPGAACRVGRVVALVRPAAPSRRSFLA